MKYKNKKSTCNHVKQSLVFSSKAEMNYFLLLQAKLKQGKISDLILQPPYQLTDSFIIKTNATKSGKSTISAMKYTPDFEYIENGKKIVVEVKGTVTTDYIMRKKLFLAKAREFGVGIFIEVFAKKTIIYEINK